MADEPYAGLLEDSAEDLYENAPCGYLSTLPGGTIVKVNRTFLDWTGYGRDELVGRTRFQDLLTAGGRIYHETHYAPLLRMQGTVREIAVDIVAADGRRLPTLMNSVLKRDDDGTPVLVRTTVFNAADRKAYEQELLWAREKAERSEARVRLLQTVVADLAAAAAVADIAAVIVRAVVDTFDAGGSLVWLLDADQQVLVRVAASGFGDDELRRVGVDAPFAHEVLARRDLVAGRADERFPVVGNAMAAAGYPAFAAVSLTADDRVLGIVAFGFCQAREFDADEVALLRTLGRHAGQAVERARLYEAERRLRRRADVLQRVTALSASAARPAELADAVLDELARTVAVGAAVLRVGDEVVGSRGEQSRLPAPDGDPRAAHFHEGERASAVLPLLVESRSIGVLALAFDEPRRFSKEERTFLVAIATQCGQALERARLHEETAERAARAAFLARTSRLLDEVPGVAQRAQRLVAVLVPDVATWAAVEVGGQRLAAAPGDASVPPPADPVSLPLVAGGEAFGALVVGHDDPAAADLPFLLDLADRAALALENARLYEQERDVAHALQRSLLAGAPPADERVQVAARYRPAVETLEVGGDWHDAFWVAEGRVGIVVGDVVGRGIEAATAMGQLRSAVRALAAAELGPARVLERLDCFVEQVDAARMATLVYGELDLDDGSLRYACSGHPPPVLLRPGGAPTLLWDGRSAPLGAYAERCTRPEAAVTLVPGARLLLYTDGLVERRREGLDERLAALVDALDGARSTSLEAMVDDVMAALLADEEAGDDVCMLALAYR